MLVILTWLTISNSMNGGRASWLGHTKGLGKPGPFLSGTLTHTVADDLHIVVQRRPAENASCHAEPVDIGAADTR